VPDKPRILVVDDFVDGREMVAEYLVFRGFEVFEARDGREAIDIASDAKPAIILMDLTMPNVDGWEATRRLKADPKTRDITVIVISAHALDGAEVSARQAGCDMYIPKPNDLAVLGDLLWQLVRDRDTAAPSRNTNGPSGAPARSRKSERLSKA
jgi:CheY-like chemotaxis protein